MPKYISVATQYSLYEVEDDVFEMTHQGMATLPPQVILELMVLNGKAKRIGSVGTVNALEGHEEEDEEGDPPEGAGPWLT